jgi:hypothetical protein
VVCLVPNADPLTEANPCHNPGGPGGGQFCGTSTWDAARGATVAGQQSIRAELETKIDALLGATGGESRTFIELSAISLKAAGVTESVLREMKAQGYRMPDRVFIQRDGGSSPHGAVEYSQFYLSELRRNELHIYFPASLPADANLNAAVSSAFGERAGENAYAVQTARDIVLHEMGHVQHDSAHHTMSFKDAARFFEPQAGIPGEGSPSQIGLSRLMLAARSVSHYAKTKPEEFVAEAFVRQYRGEQLSPGALHLYKLLQGPEIR